MNPDLFGYIACYRNNCELNISASNLSGLSVVTLYHITTAYVVPVSSGGKVIMRIGRNNTVIRPEQ